MYNSVCYGAGGDDDDDNAGRDSVVGIATRYGLGGPGVESRWGRDFPRPLRAVLEPAQPTVRWVPSNIECLEGNYVIYRQQV